MLKRWRFVMDGFKSEHLFSTRNMCLTVWYTTRVTKTDSDEALERDLLWYTAVLPLFYGNKMWAEWSLKTYGNRGPQNTTTTCRARIDPKQFHWIDKAKSVTFPIKCIGTRFPINNPLSPNHNFWKTQSYQTRLAHVLRVI